MADEDLQWLVGELRALTNDLANDLANDPTNSLGAEASAAGAPAPIVVAIDQGGHASRAIAFDARGTLLAETFVPISTFRSGTDRVEHDPQEIVESIRTALIDLRQALGDAARRVVAAGLATQRSSIVCWDRKTSQPLSPVLSWQDRRNAAFVERLRGQAKTVREQTGLVLSPHYGASKLRWCLDKLDNVRTAHRKHRLAAGPLAAYLLHSLLTDKPYVVDPANASRSQLWDPSRRDWSDSLLELFGVPREILPACMPSQHVYGRLPFGGSEIPLIVCTGDQSAMPFAAGELNDSTLYLNIGTGAFLQRQRTANQSDPPQLLRSVLWSDAQQVIEVQEGTVNGAGSAMDWLGERLAIDTHRAARALVWDQCQALNPPVFVNGIAGVGSPYWRPDVESRFVDDAHANDKMGDVDKVIAVIESMAFLICANIEHMRDGVAPTRVLASGGLSASNYLCDCIASLSGLPVERSALREATATGLAFLIRGRPREWRPLREVDLFEPRPSTALGERYARWRRSMAMS